MKLNEVVDFVKENKGFAFAREGWNGKGMYAVHQKGYPDGIPCNKNTAEAYGVPEGTILKFNEYLQLKMVDGTIMMWNPNVIDILANDYVVLNIITGQIFATYHEIPQFNLKIIPSKMKEKATGTPFLERLFDEWNELDAKIDKLAAFLGNETLFEKVSEKQKKLLNNQFESMCKYNAILAQRLNDLVEV